MPVSLTVFSGEELQQQNAQGLRDIGRLTPSLLIKEAGGSGAALTFQMRGQYQNDILGTVDPSVGVYVDGVYWARAYGINADLLDVSDVQILRGPQGTLFGRNTTGGAILLSTRNPDLGSLGAMASVTHGRFEQAGGTVVVNLPLLRDNVGVRLAAQNYSRDGFVRELNSGRKLGRRDNYTVRGKLLVSLGQRSTLLLSGELHELESVNNPFRLQVVGPSSPANIQIGVETFGAACFAGGVAACLQRGIPLAAAEVAAQNNGDAVRLNFPARAAAKTQTFSGTADIATGLGMVKIIAAHREISSGSTFDVDGSRYSIFATNAPQKLEQFSAEAQLAWTMDGANLSGTTGVYHFQESGTDRSYGSSLPLLNPLLASFIGEIDTRSQGAYSQMSWRITPQIGLTAGLRYSFEQKGLTSNNGSFTAGTVAGPRPGATFICQLATCPSRRSDDFDSLSYTFGVDYQPTPDVLLYAKTARGFRSGGQNLRATNAVPGVGGLVPFGPEIATSYEAGAKSEFFRNRIRFNATAYRVDVGGLQRTTTVFAPSGAATTVITNAARSVIHGAEAELEAVVTDWLRLRASGSHTDPRYKRFVAPVTGVDRSRERFDSVPRWTFALSALASRQLRSGAVATLSADYGWQSDTPLQAFNYFVDGSGATRDATTGNVISPAFAEAALEATTMKAVGIVNARAAIAFDDFELAVFGRNLANKRGRVLAVYFPGLDLAVAQRREPFTFGISGTMHLRSP